MPLNYKINVLKSLKAKGYSTVIIRKDKIISESALQNLRQGKPVSWATIETLCRCLNVQPGDILEYIPDEEE